MRLIIQENAQNAGRWAAEYIVKRINDLHFVHSPE